MKSIFSTIMNNSLFNYVKRLAIVCVFLSISAAAVAGDYYSKVVVKVASNSTGKGKVYVTGKTAISNYTEPSGSSSYVSSDDETVHSSTKINHQYKMYGWGELGYYCIGWNSEDSESVSSTDNPYEIWSKTPIQNANKPALSTYYAFFAPVDVAEIDNNITLQTIGIGTESEVGTVTFNVTNAKDVSIDDFKYEPDDMLQDGFEYVENPTYEAGKVIFKVKYTDQNIHNAADGNPVISTTIKLISKGDNSIYDEATINAISDLTPTYAMPTSYEFKGDEAELEYKVPVNATVGSQSALYATNKNNVASAVTGEWEAEVVNEQTGDDNSAFTVVRLTNGEFVVNFKPTEATTYTATLKTRVKYVDSRGQEIYSNYVSTRLSGTGIKTERSLITFNPAEWDFGEQPTGYTGSKQFSVTLENAANVTYSFGENLAEGFPFTYDASAEGYVTVIANAIAPGTYNATLTATGDNTIEGEEGNKTTATLPVSIKVGLQSPLLQAGSNQTDLYYLTWNVVPYATSHAIYEVNGETKTDITTQVTWVTTEGNQLVVSIPSDGTAKSYIVKSSGEYKEETYEAWSNVVAANMTKKLYFHVGPSVYVSGHEEMGGEVYVDDGTAGTVANVTGWTSKIEDANTYAQNTTDFSYTYYAKVSDATKYAFKGWATTLHGEPTYTDNNNPLTITETMSDENTSVDVRFLTTPYYAVFESFYYKCPAVSVATPSRGSGKVFVSLTGASVDDCTQEDVIASTEVRQVPAAKDNHGYRVYYYAKANDGANFVGWSTTADGLDIISTADTYNTMYYSTNKSKDLPHVAAPLYAVFRSDIDVRQQDRMIVYIDDEGNGNINDAKVLVNFQKGTKLKATLDGGDASLFTLSNRSGSKSGNSVTFDATQGLVELVVAYTGDLANAVGKEAKITLTATYFDGHEVPRPISIIVEEAPVITFLPTDGKGEYTIKMTNGSGVNYKMTSANTEYIKVPVTHESMSNIEMNLTQDAINDGYYFFAWQMIDGDEKRYLSYEQLCNYQFTKSVKVRPEFIHNSIATYRIANDASNTPYYDFAAAMKDAEKLYKANGSYQFVILNDTRLSDDGKKTTINVKTAVLPKGKYTIPNGVRLVIPRKGSSDFKSNLTTDDYFQGGPNRNEHIRWIVEEGTTIDVNGNAIICVLAKVACQGGLLPNGVPIDYGHIELRENCCITFNNSAKCYAYGYITGPSSSSVVMKKGTEVKELMQIQDWPGGTKMAQYYTLGTRKVFPISQFYVQNVEAPLVLEKGAKETLHAAIGVSGVTSFDFDFIGANSGFFRIGEGSFTKAYDPVIDRMKFTTKPDATTGTGSFTLGNIAFSVNLGITANIDSKEYVLPLIHSFDFIFGSGTTTTILYDAALLPSATMHVAKGATVNVASTSNVYVYGKEYATIDGVGYYGDASTLIPVYGRLAGMFKRTVEMLEDAKVVVDGQIVLNGKLYTTSGDVDPKYANITSNGGGKVVYNQIGSSTGNTYQLADQNATAIPVVPARLKNEDTSSGQYTTPAKGNTYTYVNKKWQVTSATSDPIIPAEISYVPTFTTSDYSTSAYVGGNESVGSITIATNNSDIDWSKVTWGEPVIEGDNANQFEFDFDDGNKPQGKVTFKPESDGIKTATLRITATYKPTIQMGSKSVTVTYTYSQDIHLTGNAIYLAANTLAFAELSTLYKGKSGVALFTTSNNTQPITITANPASAVTITGNTAAATIAGNTIGKVTITATQPADLTNNFAGTTITKTITITEPVVWNWGDLYFGTVNENPVTILNGATTWTLVEKEDQKNIINFEGSSPNYTASIEDQIAGKYEVTFTYSDNKGVTKDFISTVYTNPRHLRVDVNNDTVYRAVTLSANMQVNYHSNRKAVGFSSTAQNISQWKMTFLGVPDKIYFIPEGDNTWQIEESSNGINWTTSMPWKYLTTNEHFEMSLLPSTSYLRVSYGAGDVDSAYIKELYITELADVKADVKKLYMPVDGVNNAIKEVVLTYASTGLLSIRTTDPTNFQLKFSDSEATPTDVLSIPATSDENPFGIKGVDVVCKAAAETTAELQVYNGSKLVLQIPIYAYDFPQELPIKLATDQPAGGDRYYFVTTHSHNAEWDGTDGVRTLTMNNAVSDAAPYVTFAFEGAPTFISFDYTSAAKGVWKIEESTDGKNFSNVTPATDDVMADGKFKRTVSTTSKYIKVIYESAYAEKVDLTDITIVGDASVVVNPTKLELDYDDAKQLTLTTINLTAVNIATSSDNFKIAPTSTDSYAQTLSLSSTTNPDQLGENKVGDIVFDVKWTGDQMVEYGTIVITNPNDGDAVLATVELTGIKNSITKGNININTGVPSEYTLKGAFEGSSHRLVNISAAFSAGATPKPLFDYVVVYGETTTNDGSKTITTPNNNAGSNAKTPYYIYKKSADGNSYVLHQLVENANSSTKAWSQDGDDAVAITSGDAVSMYITGFCPYATTGYTKDEEGVWYFRANSDQSIDVYLQDCYIYSRAKTIDGHTFADRSDGHSFTDSYSRGTGAVLVFVCNDKESTPMNVTIHTLDSNLLKSNYGCFLQSVAGRAFQASSPVQIRLIDNTYATASTTTLNFTDEWPASKNSKTGAGVRTNGFLSLQKQVNNAPSIDMGNSKTVVNFNGGQVELQNAQIVSTNYASSLAICPRSGKFAGIFLAYGLGTDDVGGTVNFNDGTTTVQDMYVDPKYAESYLLDRDEQGNYITNGKGWYLTTCLRTPAKTFVYGGSHCMMRACTDPTTSGGAPKDKPGEEGKLLGLYKFPKYPEAGKKGGWTEGVNGLVIVVTSDKDPVNHQVPVGYKVESVTPNTNGTTTGENPDSDDYLNFWFDPSFEPSAQPEVEKKISFWKTCMTEIAAEYAGYGGSVGGNTSVDMAGDVQMEIVKNLMYCKIDKDIREVISGENYQAPVKNPAPEGDSYLPVHPSYVGSEIEHYITNEGAYQVEDKVFYITTATADVWNAFTAPFDVANIYIMETYPDAEFRRVEGDKVDPDCIDPREECEEYDWECIYNKEDEMIADCQEKCNGDPDCEEECENLEFGCETKDREYIINEQAKHNADFASFFAVTVALGQQKDFRTIYNEYLAYVKQQDKASGLWSGTGTYDLRGLYKLTPYNGSNWKTADFYLYENAGPWTYTGNQNHEFDTQWKFPTDKEGNIITALNNMWEDDKVLLKQGSTYSMMLPFCTGCGEDIDQRTFWDYWSGKFLVFESVDGAEQPHTIHGSSFVQALMDNPPAADAETEILLQGNSSFAQLETDDLNKDRIYIYAGLLEHSTFGKTTLGAKINPTESFLNTVAITKLGGQTAIGLSRDGKIIYANSSDDNPGNGDGNTTGTHMPTVGGGNELFITAISGGINVAVAYPQHVRVLSATGAVIYSGMVQTAVDVNLPTDGIYIVSGEREVQKILY